MEHINRYHSLGQLLHDALVSFEKKTALIEAHKEIIKKKYLYQEVALEVNRLLSVLQTENFIPNKDKVAILLPNQPKWLISATAVFMGGGMIVPVDYKLMPKDQKFLIEHSEAKFIITEKGIYENLKKEGDFQNKKQWIITDLEEEENDLLNWNSPSSVKPIFHFEKITREDVACIVYSSGTSGDIKACQITHGAYLFQMQSILNLIEISDEDIFFSILPTNHAIDFMSGFLLPFALGISVMHQRVLRPEYLMSSLKLAPITYTVMVPLILEKIKTKVESKIQTLSLLKRVLFKLVCLVNTIILKLNINFNLSKYLFKNIQREFGGHIKAIITGGAPVDKKLVKFFYDIGIKLVIGYGLTEACTVLSMTSLKAFRCDSVGKPVEGVDLQIRDQSESGIGTVWVRTPTLMKGYYKNDVLTDETIVDGWLNTGDLGYLNKKGYLFLVGRRKNMVVTDGGKNVYPEEIENKIGSLSQAEEFVVFSHNYLFDLKTIKDHLDIVVHSKNKTENHLIVDELMKKNKELPLYKRIKTVYFYENPFPRTASMKIKRHEFVTIFKDNIMSHENVF